MSSKQLIDTAKALMSGHKGLLAMDESIPTCNERFAELGIAQTEEMRRTYRQLIVTTPGLAEGLSGAILADETIRQHLSDGSTFVAALGSAGIIAGIKVDAGAKALAGRPKERVTEGLDGLRERLAEYVRLGAQFAKWRGVFTIADGTPSRACIESNAHALARYALLCQEAGLVPIVEPEVLMDGDHSLARCAEVTESVLRVVFQQLNEQGALLEGLLLKPNMVLPGANSTMQASIVEVANATVQCLLRTVPAAVPGVAFLSGGQTAELASARLNAMNTEFAGSLPWALTFSFSRAIQKPGLELWAGKADNVQAAQRSLYHRVMCNRAARLGEYDASVEGKDDSAAQFAQRSALH